VLVAQQQQQQHQRCNKHTDRQQAADWQRRAQVADSNGVAAAHRVTD